MSRPTTQRRDRVLQAAQHAGPGQHDQHAGRAEQARSAGMSRPARRLRRRPRTVRRATGRAASRRVSATPMRQRQPDAVHAAAHGRGVIARADLAGDRRRRAVREEDAQVRPPWPGRCRRRPGRPGRWCPAVSHDGIVGEQEERLGDQRAERGHGQAQDLVVRGPGSVHGASYPIMAHYTPACGGRQLSFLHRRWTLFSPGQRGAVDCATELSTALSTGCSHPGPVSAQLDHSVVHRPLCRLAGEPRNCQTGRLQVGVVRPPARC